MLLGQFSHSLDSKLRLTLPSKVRNEFSSTIYLVYDFDSCLSIYSEENYKKKVAAIMQLSDFNQDNRALKRVFFSNSQELTIDSNSRVVLPKFLTEKVSIEKDVVLVGMFDHLELWDKEKFSEKELENEQNYASNAEKLIGGIN